jgi:hypothetical protein
MSQKEQTVLRKPLIELRLFHQCFPEHLTQNGRPDRKSSEMEISCFIEL